MHPLLHLLDLPVHNFDLVLLGFPGKNGEDVVVVNGWDLVLVPGSIQIGYHRPLPSVQGGLAAAPHFIAMVYYRMIILQFLIQYFSMSEHQQPPFSAITLQPTHALSTPQLPEVKVQEYHHLLKMKKALADTQLKMENRINLFKKASQKIIKQQEMNFKIFTKIQAVREKSPIAGRRFNSRKENRPLSYNRNPAIKIEHHPSPDSQNITQKLHQQRVDNARSLKQQKSRLKIVIQEQRKMDLERKLQSANGIRRRRHNAKQARQTMEQERREHLQKELTEKYVREREEFLQIEKTLNKLQSEEEQALKSWKKTMENQI